jgi:cobalt/nickel transport system permease protein
VILEPDATLRDSAIHRIDPRLRIVAALVFSIGVVLIDRSAPTALLAALLAAGFAHVPIRVIVLRLVPLNVLMIVLIATLPFSVSGEALFLLGPLRYSFEGFGQSVNIAIKGNAIVVMLTALVATIEPIQLGHALERLYVPQKLTRLFLFTVRYFSVIESEYSRLNRAMMMRGFRPRLNLHTLRSYAYLAGMLLVHALDRSERILDAMRCRGFNGHFRPFDPTPLRLHWNDGVFALVCSGWMLVSLNHLYQWW